MQSTRRTTAEKNIKPEYDKVIRAIAQYVVHAAIESEVAYTTARLCLMDALGCGLLALQYAACRTRLGPLVFDTPPHPHGARVPGTAYVLDPVRAAFNITTAIRWLDFNDTWLAAEWGHPSDNIGGLLAVADWLSQRRLHSDKSAAPVSVKTLLTAMIKAYEIQGILALENSFNRVGLDHVILVKVATTAVVTHLLGGDEEAICRALSLAWVDGQSLRTYRHAPNTGPRKSWAAGDAASRGVRLAFMAMAGETGYPSALSTPTWGFYDVSFKGNPFTFPRPYSSYVMENILFKIAFPAEFHAQTAVEGALKLHANVKNTLDQIDKIIIRTHESAVRIISKQGALHNPADRDHCLQYMVAIALIFGELTAEHYEDTVACDPRIDALREKMTVIEESAFSQDYLDPNKRAITNAIQVIYKDGRTTEEHLIEYPLGHRRRREESLPTLQRKFEQHLQTSSITAECQEKLLVLFGSQSELEAMSVSAFMDLLVTS